MIDTKRKLLDTAERMFAEQGYGAVSLRQIIAEAGVNLAAIHYHFGSKQELLDEVILRKAGPMNRDRLARLDRLEAPPGGPPVEQVLEAFLMPMAEAAGQNPEFCKLMGRMQAEGILTEVVLRNFQPMLGRFLVALRNAVPDLPENEFRWRVHFMQGSIAHTMSSDPAPLAGAQDVGGFPGRIERLIAFLSGAFRAPATVAATWAASRSVASKRVTSKRVASKPVASKPVASKPAKKSGKGK
jgi:AcrR family transcriptional regulator